MDPRLAVLLRQLRGSPEGAATLLTGMAATPVAGLTGLSEGVSSVVRGRGVEQALRDAAERSERTQEALTFQPRSEAARTTMAEMGQTLEPVGEAVERVPSKVAEVAGPTAGAVTAAGLAVVDPAKLGKVAKAAKLSKLAAKLEGLNPPAKGSGGPAKASKAEVDVQTPPAAAEAPRPAKAVGKATAERLRGNPKYAERYPEVGEPVLATDPKSGKQYLTKGASAEAEEVAALREQAMADIKAGNWEPVFKVEDRYHVDPSGYPLPERTTEVALPKKQATIDQYRTRFDTPEIRERLTAAMRKGAEDPKAHNWYGMGQLESAFRHELGDEGGRAAFRDQFSVPMAATTGGAAPTPNLLMAQYGNYLRKNDLPMPAGSYEMPYPIGGRYASGNMGMYDKVMNQQGGAFSAADNPKRHNFASNFEGHQDRSTIDEQMSGGFEKGLAAPPGASYGIMEGIVNDIAEKGGYAPSNAQGLMWTALKGTEGKPMMEHINEAIYRTSVVTGLPQEEVLRRFIQGKSPLYGLGGAGVAGAMLSEGEEPL